MKRHPFWSQLRIFIHLVLMSLVFINLVLVQLKNYTPKFEVQALESMQTLTALPDDNCSGLKLPTNPRIAPTSLQTPKTPLSWWLRIGCSAKSPSFRVKRLITANQWLIFASILMATMLARLTTSSWTVAFIVCATLLSSSQPTRFIAHIGAHNIFVFLFTAWFTCLAYYLRTGSRIMIAALTSLSALAFYWGQIHLVLATLAIPLMVIVFSLSKDFLIKPVLKKLKKQHQRQAQLNKVIAVQYPPQARRLPFLSALSSAIFGYTNLPTPVHSEPHQQGLLHAFEVPFSTWVFTKPKWMLFLCKWVLMISLCLAGAFISLEYLLPGYSYTWAPSTQFSLSLVLGLLSERLLLCLILLAICLFIPPHRSVNSFFETTWAFFLAMAIIVLGNFFLVQGYALTTYNLQDHLQSTIVWLEPVLIAMSIAAVFNMIRASDRFLYTRHY